MLIRGKGSEKMVLLITNEGGVVGLRLAVVVVVVVIVVEVKTVVV